MKTTGIPNESWRNCVSYLVEIHPGVRRSFALKSPDWVMAASPYAFSDDERTTLVTRLFEQLASRGQYIRRHPSLASDAVARFVTPEVRDRLARDITAVDPVRAGNALAVLGACKDNSVVGVALTIALNQNHPQLLRESAISTVAAAGDASLIPALVNTLDTNDQLELSLIDCIGALTDPASIPTVLLLLLKTDAMVSSAFYRFRELRSRGAVEGVPWFYGREPERGQLDPASKLQRADVGSDG